MIFSGGSGTSTLSAHWVQRRDAMWAGFAPADGQLFKRADYPDAWAAIEAGKVPVTTDAIWLAAASNRGGFSTGDGSTTFRVPDYNGKSSGSLGAAFLCGDGLNSAGTGGVIQGDAIRNITGSFGGSNATPFHSVDARHTNGAMKTVGVTTSFRAAFEPSSAGAAVLFDASKVVPTAADNHPVNVTGCWAVKLFGAEVNPGLVNVTALQDRITELENKHYFYGHKFTPIAIASNSNTLLKVTNVQASNGITLHANKDSVTVSKAGLYKLSYSYALEPQGYPQNTTLTVYITGQPSDTVAYSYIPTPSGSNSVMSPANWSGVYKLNAGDNISFRVSTVNATQASVWWTGFFHVEEI